MVWDVLKGLTELTDATSSQHKGIPSIELAAGDSFRVSSYLQSIPSGLADALDLTEVESI